MGRATSADDHEAANSIDRHADALWDAAAHGRPIEPPTAGDPTFDVAAAYAVQERLTARRIAEGGIVRGRKIGLTSTAMQRQLGVDEPDYGVLFADMLLEDGDEIAFDRLLQPRAEAEIAFVLAEDLAGPGATAGDVVRASAGVCAAIEIIDSRIVDWRITLPDTIADNASSGLVVAAGRLVPIADLDLRLLGAALYRNGDLVETGAGAAVLGNPARCVAWLANKLAMFDERLHAGDLILAGALHRAVEIAPGSVLRAEFSQLGAVTTRFSAEEEA
jgi:2-keto-4-pentenoate hydratase